MKSLQDTATFDLKMELLNREKQEEQKLLQACVGKYFKSTRSPKLSGCLYENRTDVFSHVTDFSVGGYMLGVSFATEDEGFVIYNRPAAPHPDLLGQEISESEFTVALQKFMAALQGKLNFE